MMIWIWRILLFLLFLLWLWHAFVPERWRIKHHTIRRLAWIVIMVFGTAFLWQMWALFGH